MSDLFHEDVPFDHIDGVFEVMAKTQRHTYQILTKRSGRMRAYTSMRRSEWPGNVWAGVTIENSDNLSRAADLRQMREAAKVLFISFEPLLGPVYLFQAARRIGTG